MNEHNVPNENRSSTNEMENMKKPLRDLELRLISELMRNSRRSDRELAKALGVSQPTVSRMIKKLEKEEVIKEYTMIPDFRALGYSIMAATTLAVGEPYTEDRLRKVREGALELERKNPNAFMLAVNGLSMGKNRLFIVLYKNYSDYVSAMRTVKQFPFINVDTMDSFLADLNDETNYRVLSMSAIGNHLLQRLEKKE